MCGEFRQTGRTTRQLMPLIAAAMEGKRVAYIVATYNEIEYTMRLVNSIVERKGLTVSLGLKRICQNRITFEKTKGRIDFHVWDRRVPLFVQKKGWCERMAGIRYHIIEADHHAWDAEYQHEEMKLRCEQRRRTIRAPVYVFGARPRLECQRDD